MKKYKFQNRSQNKSQSCLPWNQLKPSNVQFCICWAWNHLVLLLSLNRWNTFQSFREEYSNMDLLLLHWGWNLQGVGRPIRINPRLHKRNNIKIQSTKKTLRPKKPTKKICANSCLAFLRCVVQTFVKVSPSHTMFKYWSTGVPDPPPLSRT